MPNRSANTERGHFEQKAKRRNAFCVPALNYVIQTLVRESDAEARHSEILMIAAVTRHEILSRINDGLGEHRNSVELEDVVTRLGNEVESIRMIFLAKDKVPGEVSH